MIYLVSTVFSLLITVGIINNDDNNNDIEKKQHKIYMVNKNDIKNTIIMVMSALPLFLVSALRYGIGTDYFFTYAPQFLRIRSGYNEYYEVGFYILNKVIGYFTANYQWLFIVTSFLFIYFMYKGIYQQSKCYFISIALFILSYTYFISMNNVRQSLATAIILFSIKYLKKQQKLKYTIMVLIATSIHQISAVYLIFLFIDKIKISSSMSCVIAVTTLFIGKWIAPSIIKQLWKIPRLQYYLNTGLYSDKSISSLFLLVNLIILLMYFVIEIFYEKKDGDKFDLVFANYIQLLIIACCALDGMIPATYRIVRVFTFLQIITIPNVIELITKKEKKLIFYIITVVIFIMLFLQSYFSGIEEVFPYQSIFDK